MQTYTIDSDASCHAPTAPLMLHTAAASRRRDLTAGGSVRPVMRETATAAPCDPATASRLARVTVADARSMEDRVVDRVVDGLMAELGWAGAAATPRRRS